MSPTTSTWTSTPSTEEGTRAPTSGDLTETLTFTQYPPSGATPTPIPRSHVGPPRVALSAALARSACSSDATHYPTTPSLDEQPDFALLKHLIDGVHVGASQAV